jgi:acyl-CoA thioesterase FadM
MRYAYTAALAGGEIAAEGFTTHCFVGRDFKPMTLKRKFPDYYAKLKQAAEETAAQP